MTKKKAPRRPAASRSTTPRARINTKRAKKKAANKKAHAKKKSAKKRNAAPGTKKPGKRAFRATRRKPKAPDMSMYRRDGRKLTDEQIVEAKGMIVRTIAMRGNVREATDAAGIARTLAYAWKGKDEGFSEAWDAALAEAVDRMEEEAWRRGIDGFDRPVIYQGEITDTYKDYSDSLLLVMLKGHRPEKYKERTEHSTPPGQPMQLEAETKLDVVSSILGMIQSKPDPD